MSRALGEEDEALAREKASTSLIWGIFFAAVFAALVWFNIPALTRLMGASGATEELATGYLRIIIPSLPLLVIGMLGSAILRAYGDARRSMFATVSAGVVNAVLDPILIFGLDLELTGAALASVAARAAMAAVALRPVIVHHGGLVRPDFKCLIRDFSPLAVIAFPAILTQLATPIGQAYVTRSMAEFGEEAVAGMAIIGRLVPVSLAVLFALSGAIGPIIGQNYGAKKYDRVERAFREGVLFCALTVVFVTVCLYLLRVPIANLFQTEGIARDLIFLFCGPLALAWFFNGVIFVTNASFNNLGHPFYSTWINWGRHTLGTIPFVIAGAAWLGAPGVLIGQAFGGAIFAGIGLLLVLRVQRIARREELQPSTPHERQMRLFQLFNFRH